MVDVHGNRFESPVQAKQFIQGGNARVTLKSRKTGHHYTFRVRQSQDGEVWFVGILMDGDSAFIAQGPALSAALAEDGYEVRVDPSDAKGWGERRAVAPEPGEEGTVVWLLSGDGEVRPPPGGELVARGTLPREPGGVDNSWNEDTFEVWVVPPDG